MNVQMIIFRVITITVSWWSTWIWRCWTFTLCSTILESWLQVLFTWYWIWGWCCTRRSRWWISSHFLLNTFWTRTPWTYTSTISCWRHLIYSCKICCLRFSIVRRSWAFLWVWSCRLLYSRASSRWVTLSSVPFRHVISTT